MKVELKKFNIETKFNDVVKLTDEIKAFVESTGVKEGQCIVFNPHTTAGLTITSFWDPNGFEDIQDEVCRLIPTGSISSISMIPLPMRQVMSSPP